MDEDGELSLDTGAFVTALEYATQREAVLLGKPAPDFFHAALASIACDGKEAVMVGDDAEADVAGALGQVSVPPSSSAPANTAPVTRARQSLRRAKRSQTLQRPHDGSWSAAPSEKAAQAGGLFQCEVYSAAAFPPLTARKAFIESSIASSHGV